MTSIVSTQFTLAQAVISNGVITGNEWSNPDNLLLTDGDVASSNPNETASDVIIGNFPFSLPTDAVITGIEIEILGAYSGSPTSPSITLTPYFVDNTGGAIQYYPYQTPQVITITPTDYTLGSSNYQFASSFTPEQINNAKIALVANGNINVDAIKMKVYYYIAVPATPPDVIGNNCEDCNSPIQVQNLSLALPFYSGDRYMYLSSFNYPDGTPVNFADLGSCGGVINFVIDPELSKLDPVANGNFAENVVTNVWEVMPNGNIRFDFGVQSNVSTTRGLAFHTPYTADPLLRSNHNVGARVVISDNGPFLGQLLRLCQVGSIFSAPIEILYNNVSVVDPATQFDFRGAGVSVVNAGAGKGVITIAGAGGTTPPQVVSTTYNSSLNVQVTTLSADLQISGLNRGVVIQVSTEQSKTITGITVGGVAATQKVVSTDAAANLRQETWFIANPALGPQPIVVTMSAAAYIAFGAECVSGLDPVTPTGATQTAIGNNFAPTLSLNTTVDYSLVIDGLATALTPILHTAGAGQSLNWTIVANGNTRQGSSSVESAGISPDPITMNYSITQSTRWCYTAIELVGITTINIDNKVAVDASDTTAGFLDDKIEILNGVNTVVIKTVLNPGANEKIRYQINASGGGGGGGNYRVDQAPLGTGSTYGLITGAINSVNTLFTVATAAYVSGSLMVFLNGLELQQGSSSDWVETTPASGTFTLALAPNTGDIITVIYQSANTIAQAGIQWENEGVNLGAPGTVNEVDFVGAGVNAARVGNKVTVTVTAGQAGIQWKDEGGNLGAPSTVDAVNYTGAGVNASRAGNEVTVNIPGGSGGVGVLTSQFLPVGKMFRTSGGGSESGDEFDGNVFTDVGTNRIYSQFRLRNPSSTQFSIYLRVFKNSFGSYYQETEIILTRSMLSNTSSAFDALENVVWTSDGSFVYAIARYVDTTGAGVTRIDVIRFNLDGTGDIATNIYNVASDSNTDQLEWNNSNHGTSAAVVVAGALYITWTETISGTKTDQLRRFSISGTTYTLTNTYTRSGFDNAWNARSLTYNTNNSTFYLSGGDNNSDNVPVYIEKWTISGSNFVLGASITYPEFGYFNTQLDSDLDEGFTVCFLSFSASSYVIYVVQGMENRNFTSSHTDTVTAFWLTSYNYPIF